MHYTYWYWGIVGDALYVLVLGDCGGCIIRIGTGRLWGMKSFSYLDSNCHVLCRTKCQRTYCPGLCLSCLNYPHSHTVFSVDGTVEDFKG